MKIRIKKEKEQKKLWVPGGKLNERSLARAEAITKTEFGCML